ncbi:hypothetical protein [Streptomyces avicenniae]|uniref:hypothetical protein n=1 Tax=Streptomyces avicenniae TaxID=500153 RepID=UPI00069A7B86|nr:hypothetical protein [Streptomyces avicenniae]
MSGIPFSHDVRDQALTQLTELVENIAEELEDQPTLGEFLEVLGWAIPTGNSALADAVALPQQFKTTLRKGRRYAPAGNSRIGDLTDATFSDATDLLAFLAEHAHAASGGPVGVTELTAAVVTVLTSAPISFADVNTGELLRITPAGPPRRVPKPKSGDIVAIPAKDGGFHMAVVLVRNRFGTALGLFRGTFSTPRVGGSERQAAVPYPVYTDEELIAEGGWRTVGHDPDLSALFPHEPEIYHRPGTDQSPYGVAETAGGRMRHIKRAEAEAVGLLDGTYRQIHQSDYVQKHLDEGTL